MLLNKLSFLVYGSLLATSLMVGRAQAEPAEPVDKNTSGATMGVNMAFGQSIAAGGHGPGIAWLMSVEPGYGAARDAWNRIEPSLELGTGGMEFKLNDSTGQTGTSKVPLKFFALAKVGYGYSVGRNSFAIWRFGAGPAMLDYSQTVNGIKLKATDSLTGFMARLGMDFTSPITDSFDVNFGFHFNYLTFTVDALNRSFQVNTPLMQFGGRMRF